jgi:folate-binding protein YgfZ
MDETPVEHCRLSLAVLGVRGADARRFLQGQLSADVIGLPPAELRWAGLHNPQGRALATLRLLADGDDVIALLPPERMVAVLPLLRRYLLRAKARIDDESGQWHVLGVFASARDAATRFVDAAHSGRTLIGAADAGGGRCVVLQAASNHADATAESNAPSPAGPSMRWKRADIAAGLPQVYDTTAGRFIAQMLNLDLIGGVAFDKGCYTGQEVIARAHYRGRVKRRMQRFGSHATRAADWPPGALGQLPDGRRFEVVDSVDLEGGGCEWLAVTTFGQVGGDSVDAEPAAATAGTASARLCADATPLPLPYALPGA